MFRSFQGFVPTLTWLMHNLKEEVSCSVCVQSTKKTKTATSLSKHFLPWFSKRLGTRPTYECWGLTDKPFGCSNLQVLLMSTICINFIMGKKITQIKSRSFDCKRFKEIRAQSELKMLILENDLDLFDH